MNAIEKLVGPCIILAGAGTGKTYTIVEKIKYMVGKGHDPEKIVCITFSNEAANNLILRIDKALKELSVRKSPVIRTFHGFSADLLRLYGDKIDISKDFKILDSDQAMVLLHRNLKIHALNCPRYISTIGAAKDLGIKIEDFQAYLESSLKRYEGIDIAERLETLNFQLQTMHLKSNSSGKSDLLKEIKKLRNLLEIKKFVSCWNAYEKLKKKNNYQDYSDLNKNALELLQKFPELADNYSYVIVDEFQDTNKLQLDFVFSLAKAGNISVVGDLNQSIYRFRGAYKENINLFAQHFNVRKEDIFNLDKSFRSPNKVLRVAHKLIVNNYQKAEDCFFVENAHNTEGDNVQVHEITNGHEEARKIIELINNEVENGASLEDICIMFRAHQHGRIIKRALEGAEIPYFSVSKASLLKQKSIKTVCDYLSIVDKLKKKARGGEQEWWDLVYRLDFSQDDLILIGREIKNINKNKRFDENEKSNDKILSIHLFNALPGLQLSNEGKLSAKSLIERIKLILQSADKPLSELVKDVYNIAGLINEQKSREEVEVMLNLNKFLELAKSHEGFYDSDLSNFLYYLDILNDLGINIEAAQLEEKGVRLMSCHSTKGLEYDTVILSNFSQGRFPIERYIGNSLIPTELIPEIRDQVKGLSEEDAESFVLDYEKHQQLLEERRLCYVSFTRAKKKLILTYAKDYSKKKSLPSQFLNEITFKQNNDVSFEVDSDEKYIEPPMEIKPANEFSKLLGSQDFDKGLAEISLVTKGKKEHGKFSPSALMLFGDCQKQFEYKYVFNMPDRKTISWEAMRLGSFVHKVLEKAVKKCIVKIEDMLQLTKEMSLDEEWEGVELNEAETLIKVFFERNKGKYNEKTKTEQYLPLNLSGLEFIGFADRIDFVGDEAIIVDYKTGKSAISPRDRNLQLGFYALAAQEKYGRVRKVVLDMLKQDKPLEFEIDERGNAVCISSNRIDGFNIYEVEQQLVMTAESIQQAYKNGFKACSVDKNCEFCNEYVYGLQ